MLRAMICQPMSGLTNEQVIQERWLAVKYLKGQGYEVTDTLFEEWRKTRDLIERSGAKNFFMYLFAKGIEVMASCDVVYFVKGWEESRGCKLEYQVAKAYGMEIIIEGEDD